MRVFIYEFVTGGGWWSIAEAPPAGSLLTEGWAMHAAVCSDFARLPGIQIVTLADSRLAASCDLIADNCEVVESSSGERQLFERLAAASDWTLLIAPEFDSHLLTRCQWARAAGGRLLSPDPDVVRLAADKQATAQLLAARHVPVPRGILAHAGQAAPADLFPAVLKPRDGCGSVGISKLESISEFQSHSFAGTMLLEQLVPGLAASVAVLCGPAQAIALPACEQVLSQDGRFAYLGGKLPLAPPLDQRARRLAIAAVQALPAVRGYLGVDLVLGSDASGRGDRVIEINPRLTTSYVGLRALCHENLAAAMLALAQGDRVDLTWREEPIEFTTDGQISPTDFTSLH